MNDIAVPFASPGLADSPAVSDPAGPTPDLHAEVTTDAVQAAGGVASLEAGLRFRAIVDANFDFIWRTLRGLGVPAHSVDDAAQHVFLVAAQKLTRIEPGSERAFLFGTAVGVAANARRARARSREVLDEGAVANRADSAPDGERLLELRERRALLDQVLASMPDDLREVFVLFVLEGLETPQIARLLGLPKGTVASRLRRARETFHVVSKRLQAAALRPGGAR
jgi:RNA polymerase sigma-70 factor (ECF subfamily)